MSVIYTSKGMSKILGCALYIRCALSIEKYGNYKNISVHATEIYGGICTLISNFVSRDFNSNFQARANVSPGEIDPPSATRGIIG
jgi:hypothetical protein